MSETHDEKGLFWNSDGDDRLYDANSLGKWLSRFFTTGVFPGDFEITPVSGMTLSMAPGYVNINNPDSANPGGKVRLFEDDTELTIETAHTVYPRIDTVVIERNDNNRDITVKVIMGTASATPTPTAPVRTSSVYQLVLAEIYVAAGTVSIGADDITMKRTDDSVCGIVTGTVTNNQIYYGNTDLTPGVSELADGAFYFMYE